MVYPQWNPIPTYTARHNSKIRRNNETYRIRKIKEYLANPIGCQISAENADPQDPHLTDVKIDGGHLTFHTAIILFLLHFLKKCSHLHFLPKRG